MTNDGISIECSCGFSGVSEVRDKDAEIGKAVAICPECSTVHIVETEEDDSPWYTDLMRTETGVV